MQKIKENLSFIEDIILLYLYVPCGSAGKESTCNVGELGSIPGLGRCSEEGKGYPLHYSDLENSMDREPGRLQSIESQRVRHN